MRRYHPFWVTRMGAFELVALRIVSRRPREPVRPWYERRSVGTVAHPIDGIGLDHRAAVDLVLAQPSADFDDRRALAVGADLELLARREDCQRTGSPPSPSIRRRRVGRLSSAAGRERAGQRPAVRSRGSRRGTPAAAPGRFARLRAPARRFASSRRPCRLGPTGSGRLRRCSSSTSPYSGSSPGPRSVRASPGRHLGVPRAVDVEVEPTARRRARC